MTRPLRWMVHVDVTGSLNLATPARPAATAGRCSNIRAIALDAPPDQLPTLSDAIPDCPRTTWDADELDIEFWQKKYKEEDLPLCPIEVIATKAGRSWWWREL